MSNEVTIDSQTKKDDGQTFGLRMDFGSGLNYLVV